MTRERRLAALAEAVRGARESLVRSVTEELLERHPHWLERFPTTARRRCLEDTGFHVDFFVGALEAGERSAFEDYCRWTARMLAARGIGAEDLASNLDHLTEVLGRQLGDEAREGLEPLLTAGREAALETARPESQTPPGGPLAPVRKLFLQAILRGERAAASSLAAEALARSSVEDVYVEIFQEALYEVGRLWQANRLSVADEHVATATVQYVIAQVYPGVTPAGPPRGRLVITGVEGELHQLGATLVADVLEAHGWDVRFLGSNLPHAAILQAVEEHEPDVVGISTTLVSHLPATRALVGEMQARFGLHAPGVLVGGRAFRNAGALVTEMGAELLPDARSAASRLCS